MCRRRPSIHWFHAQRVGLAGGQLRMRSGHAARMEGAASEFGRADQGAAARPLGRGPRAKAKKLEAEIEPLKEEFERRGLSVVAGEAWGVARSESTFASLDVKAIRAEMGPEWRPKREKPREARVHQFCLLKGAVMAAYRSTLACQSLFDKSRFFGRQEEARLRPGLRRRVPRARCGARTLPSRSPRGRAPDCSRSWPSSPTKCGRCTPWRGRPSSRACRGMPRKVKPTPGEACGGRLNDLRREHGRPPADAKPHESERFAGMMLLAAMRRAYERASLATAPPRSPGSSRAGTSSASGNRPSRY